MLRVSVVETLMDVCTNGIGVLAYSMECAGVGTPQGTSRAPGSVAGEGDLAGDRSTASLSDVGRDRESEWRSA